MDHGCVVFFWLLLCRCCHRRLRPHARPRHCCYRYRFLYTYHIFWTTISSAFIASHCFAGFVCYLSEVVVVGLFSLALFDFYFSIFSLSLSRSHHRLTRIIKRSEKNVSWERNRNEKKTWGLDNSSFGQLICVFFCSLTQKIDAIQVSSYIFIYVSKVQLSCAHEYVFLFGGNNFFLWKNSVLFNYSD